MPDIFISYSRKDKTIVQQVVERLQATGRDVWVDWQDIPWTADWWQEISQGIEQSDNFVFVLSPASLSSIVCNFEVAHAIQTHKRIVPIVVETANPQKAHEALRNEPLDDIARRILNERDLSGLLNTNWQYLARHNWLFFNDPLLIDQSFANLLDALDTDLDHVRKHTHFLVQANEWNNKDRDSSFLLVGKEIIEAENWLSTGASKIPAPTQLHSEHIFASRRHATGQQRRLLFGVSVGLVATLILALAAIGLWQQASFERDRADEQAQIARSGRVALQGLLQLGEGHLDSALLLAVQAIGIRDSRESRSSLLTSLQSAPRVNRFLQTEGNAVISSIVYRPDGKQAAVADSEGKIILWDTEQKSLRGVSLLGHDGDVWDLDYSPDGQTLASVGADGRLLLWDVTSGTLRAESETLDDEIFAVSFSPDGKWIATGGADYIVRLWDASTAKLLNDTLDEHEDYVEIVAISPNGRWLATGGDDNRILLWDTSDLENVSLVRELEGHSNAVLALDFSPDNQRLASGGADNTVRLWDVNTGAEIGQPLTDHIDWVWMVDFSADNQLLASSSGDASIILRNPQTGRRLEDVPPLEGHSNEVGAIDISPDGRQLLSGDTDGNVLLWNIDQDQPLSRIFARRIGEIDSLLFSPDGTRLLSAGHEGNASGSAVMWDAQTGTPVFEPFEVTREVVTVDYSPDGSLFVYGIADGSMVLRSASTGEVLQTTQAHDSSIHAISFSSDSKLLATAGEDGSAIVWKLPDLEIAYQFQHDSPVMAMDFSPDGQVLALGDDAGTVILWNFAQNTRQQTAQPAHSASVTSLSFSHRGDLLASASRDGSVVLWDVAAAAMRGLPMNDHENWVLDVDFSPDDQLLASSSRDKTIILWDVATQHIIGEPLTGARDWVWSIAFSPDGTTLASGSRDGEIRLWTVNMAAWIRRACTVAGRSLTDEERALYLADVSQLSTVCDNDE